MAFVYGRLHGEWRAAGTAFFVSVASRVGVDQHHVYAITCKHVLRPDLGSSAELREPWELLALRINTRSGSAALIEMPLAAWTFHESSDIAALAHVPDQSVYDYLHYPLGASATPQFRNEHSVTPGEDVVISGLLVNSEGKRLNMPIVRVGNIAAFPEDDLVLTTGKEEVVLVEARSIGGLSGSPAFLHFGNTRRNRDGDVGILRRDDGSVGGPNYLLGVVHGYLLGDGPNGELPKDLNTGIAVVLPVERVSELIMGPLLRNDRAKREARMLADD